MTTVTGFLRGINVGGHHKVPMADLRNTLTKAGCENVRTLLNSGNIVFETKARNLGTLEPEIEARLSQAFGFAIPLVLRTRKEISDLVNNDPFQAIKVHKDIRLYISFLKDEPGVDLSLPYYSKDRSYQILSVSSRIIASVLDLSATKTPKGMEELEKIFGKNITTRNWNTIQKIVAV